jgi:hypothetical protein
MKSLFLCVAIGMALAYCLCWWKIDPNLPKWHDFFSWTVGVTTIGVFYIREIRSTFQKYLSLPLNDAKAEDELFTSAQIRIREADHVITWLLTIQMCSLLLLKLNKAVPMNFGYFIGYTALAISIGGALYVIMMFVTNQDNELELQKALHKYKNRERDKKASVKRTKVLMAKLRTIADIPKQNKPIQQAKVIKPDIYEREEPIEDEDA